MREPEIADDLGPVGIHERLSHLQLYNHKIIHQEAQPEGLRNQMATVGQAEFDLTFDLTFDPMPIQTQFMDRAGFVRGFQQPWPERALNTDRGADHGLRQFSMGAAGPRSPRKSLFGVFQPFSVSSVSSFFRHGW